MIKATCVFLFFTVLISATKAQNYCAANLCPFGRTHIACRNNGAFGPQCGTRPQVVNLSTMRALILQMHNVRRNIVAGGNLSGFSPATRMAEVTWDDELARIALLNAKRCFMQHDQCRNTPTYPRSGQNIGQTSSRGIPNYLRRHLITVIQGWYQEYKDTNMNIINSFSSPKTVGHFTQMMSDRITKIGCGSIRHIKNGRNTLLTTCNYAVTNILNRAVYKAGTTGSACTSGRSSRYPNLCSPREPISPQAI